MALASRVELDGGSPWLAHPVALASGVLCLLAAGFAATPRGRAGGAPHRPAARPAGAAHSRRCLSRGGSGAAGPLALSHRARPHGLERHGCACRGRQPARPPCRPARPRRTAPLRILAALCLGGAGGRLRRAADPAARPASDRPSAGEPGGGALGRFPPDLPEGGAGGLDRRLRPRIPGRRRHRPDPLPAARPAAAGQSGERRAGGGHRPHHGDVVRLRLALQGRGHRGDDLLPHADQHARRLRRGGCDQPRPHALLWRQLLADLPQAPAAQCAAFHLQRPQDQLDPGHDRGHRRRVLRLAHRRHGLPDQRRGRPA